MALSSKVKNTVNIVENIILHKNLYHNVLLVNLDTCCESLGRNYLVFYNFSCDLDYVTDTLYIHEVRVLGGQTSNT